MKLKYAIFIMLSVMLNAALAEPAYVTLRDRLAQWGYDRVTQSDMQQVEALPETQAITKIIETHMPNVKGLN